MWPGAKFQLPLVKSHLNSWVSEVVVCRDSAFFQSISKLCKAFQRNFLSVQKAKNAEGLCGKSSHCIKLMFPCDNIPMSSTRKYRQNGVDINKTLLNEKRNIVMKHFEFSYFVSI